MSLRRFLADKVQGATFAGLTTFTSVTLPKSSKHYGRVKKLVRGSNVVLFANKRTNGYNNMVKRRLIEEGIDPDNFTLSPRKWGTRLPNAPIVEHNGQQYLEVIYLRSGETSYYLDGVLTTKQSIEGLKEPVEAEQGGLENKVIIRTPKIESIVEITIDGETYAM